MAQGLPTLKEMAFKWTTWLLLLIGSTNCWALERDLSQDQILCRQLFLSPSEAAVVELSPGETLIGLRALIKAGVSTRPEHLQMNSDPLAEKVLSEELLRPMDASELWGYANRYFVSSDIAVMMLGLGDAELPDHLAAAPKKVTKGLRLRASMLWMLYRGFGVSPKALVENEDVVWEATKAIFGKGRKGKAFEQAVRRNIDLEEWRDQLLSIGFQQEDITHQMTWSHQKIVDAIRALFAEGIPLNANHVRRNFDPKAIDVLSRLFRRKLSPYSLYGIANYYFGSWDLALQTAGFEVERVRRRLSRRVDMLPDYIEIETTHDSEGRRQRFVSFSQGVVATAEEVEQQDDLAFLDRSKIELDVSRAELLNALLRVLESEEVDFDYPDLIARRVSAILGRHISVAEIEALLERLRQSAGVSI